VNTNYDGDNNYYDTVLAVAYRLARDAAAVTVTTILRRRRQNVGNSEILCTRPRRMSEYVCCVTTVNNI